MSEPNLIKRVISKEVAELIIQKLPPKNKKVREFTDPLILKILKTLDIELDNVILGNSYIKVERMHKGHKWHHDTGAKDHMTWCNLSVSILLTDPKEFTGGGIHFRNAGVVRIITPLEHYLNALVYSSMKINNSNEHKVLPHHGRRKVLLMFLEINDNP